MISFAKQVNQLIKIEMQHCVGLTTEKEAKKLQFVASEKDDYQQQMLDFVEGVSSILESGMVFLSRCISVHVEMQSQRCPVLKTLLQEMTVVW